MPEALEQIENDPLTPTEHANLDIPILNIVNGLDQPGKPGDLDLADILFELAQGYPVLDQSLLETRTVVKLFATHPGLRGFLTKCCLDRSFRAARNLKIFRVRKKTDVPVNAEVLKSQKTATEQAWNTQYKGNNHMLLFKTITNMNHQRGMDFHGNYLPIVQSSGTGKSRTVHELSNLVFTIPFNLRDKSEANGFGFPYADLTIFEYFVRTSSERDVVLMSYLRFFISVFRTVTAEVLKLPVSQKQSELAAKWRAYLEKQDSASGGTNRARIYAAAVDSAQNVLSPEDRRRLRKNLQSDNNEPSEKDILEAECESCAKELAGTIESRSQEQYGHHLDIRFVMYFDEAHSLTSRKLVDESRSLYDVLCSALVSIVKVSAFSIFLSTNSNLSKLAPPKDRHPSDRVVEQDRDVLQAPFTELPFDCLKGIFNHGDMDLRECGLVHFMIKFGRPLFWTRWNAGDLTVRKSIVTFARQKLVGYTLDQLDKDLDKVRMAHLAVLSIRLLLDFEPRREVASSTEAKLVEGHMRIAFSVPRHRDYFRSGTPSEPILAEAAAQELQKMEQKRTIEDLVQEYLQNGIIDKGSRGELVARLLLTKAHDSVIRANPQPEAPYSAPISLIAFLTALFGKGNMEKILESCPDNTSGKKFKDVFKDAQVRFTHFGRAGEKGGVSTEECLAALVRGMAIQAKFLQKSIDIAIPFTMTDEKLCEEIVSVMLISVKNRTHNDPHIIDEARIGVFPKENRQPIDKNPRPYIALQMHLGMQHHAPGSRKPTELQKKKLEASGMNVTPSKLIVGERGTTRSKGIHPRYSISVYGCSDSVYGVIDREKRHEYAQLLASRDLVSEHARQDEESVAAIRRMKPFWEPGKDFYDWMVDKSLHEETIDEAEPFIPDGVYVSGEEIDVFR